MDSGRLEVPPGTVHLDTVRALHQTVVSLRTALEVSKNELKELKQKYEQHSQCGEYEDVIEKLTLENHILRRKIIDSGQEEKDSIDQNINLGDSYSPPSANIEEEGSEVVIKTSTTNVGTTIETKYGDVTEYKNKNFCSTENLNQVKRETLSPELNVSAEISAHDDSSNVQIEDKEDPSSQITIPQQETSESHQSSFKTRLELLSKFDVRIKVRTLKEGSVVSNTTSDSETTTEEKKEPENKEADKKASFHFEERKEHFENCEDPKGNQINFSTVSTESVKMAVPNEAEAKSKTDKFDVQVRITSEENLIVKETTDRTRRKDTLNLDVDDLSLRSLSEGDNSVFSEGVVTPIDPSAKAVDDKDQDNASGNESEEVDDIELIFTTDESKDMSNLQEDLVSIRETEQWAPSSTSTAHSTPVLIKFHTLDPDFQPGGETRDNAENENQENSSLQSVLADCSLKVKRVSLPSEKEIKHVAFNGKGGLELPGRGILKSYDNKSDNMLYKKSPNTSTRRLDSVDSLTCEYNRGLSFDNTKSSSFELGSSMDILHRDESVDSFQRTSRLGHRFSVFAETDISKCGISEDDLSSNLNARRNTCPNPFQYKPSFYRGVSRPPGPFKATLSATNRVRPVLRDGIHPRRENGAQTDVSALPPRWSSDGYLAYKSPLCATPTLPQRAPPRRPAARPSPPVPRRDDSRRVLLSDIGFTSMVPELSRSADPVWALGKRIGTECSAVSTSTSKFFSRGSSYRSPCLSIDRSNEWTPQIVYLPPAKMTMFPAEYRPWRSSLPDVRYERDDTDELLEEAETFLRRSIDNLHSTTLDFERSTEQAGTVSQLEQMGQPYIPAEPRNLRLGHTVKVITPHGRIAVGRVRYVGIAGGTAATSGVVIGAEFLHTKHPGLPRNDGTHRGRRYFLTSPHHTALFVPFSKVVMAWAN